MHFDVRMNVRHHIALRFRNGSRRALCSREAKLLEVHEAKAAIGSGALRKLSPAEAAKARTQDLRRLFSIGEQGD